MTKLRLDPIVLATFRKAHPKPAGRARQLLQKYLDVLQDEIDKAKQRNRTALERKGNCYRIHASRLTNEGGQFGKNGKRVHSWLEQNGLALIEFVEKSNSSNRCLSLIKLSNLVFEFEDELDGEEYKNIYCIAATESSATKLAKRYEEEILKMNALQFEATFDVTPVNTTSLQNYIDWLNANLNLNLTEGKRHQKLNQAKHIKTISDHFDGKFVQRKIPSEFGRTYYEGTSVQNVGKDLRSAVLGDCWEYDIRSSVVAWKMKFANEFLQSTESEQPVERAFRASIWFLTGKAEMMQRIQEQTFDVDSNVAIELQAKLIKRAMTAICFGARSKQTGWRMETGKWAEPALTEIIKNKIERERFFSCAYVREFVQEQNWLDSFLFEKIGTLYPEKLKSILLREDGKPNKNKVIAWLYQNAETLTMSHIYEYIEQKGIKVIAKVHDAFFIRHKLSADTLQDLETEIETLTDISYFRLGTTKIEKWNASLSAEEHERIEEHKRFRATELEMMRKKKNHCRV
jgi:hypothetical protein